VHLVYPSFRPTFFSNHGIDLLAEGFDKLGIRKKTVQYLRDRLLTRDNKDYIIGGERMSSLAKDVEWIAAKLTRSNLRATPSTDLSTPLASLMSHMSISFCESAL
jgi:hypothetical protein